jgi:hypothetical protein
MSSGKTLKNNRDEKQLPPNKICNGECLRKNKENLEKYENNIYTPEKAKRKNARKNSTKSRLIRKTTEYEWTSPCFRRNDAALGPNLSL